MRELGCAGEPSLGKDVPERSLRRGDRTAWRKYANPSGGNTGGGGSSTASPAPAPTPSHDKVDDKVDWEALATAVQRDEYGNLPQRRTNLDAAYGAGAYDRVQAIVNARMGGGNATTSRPSTGSRSVVVRSGNTISAIAPRTGLYPITEWSVPSGNINLIYLGQIVSYNGGGSTAPASNAPPSGRTVTVKRGDTLSGIAARLGIQWTQLHGYRSGNPSLIYPGEALTY